MIRQLVGDCRDLLPTLGAGSIQAVVTSPPYYGLRDYGTPPLVWGGIEHEHCFGPDVRAPWANNLAGANSQQQRGINGGNHFNVSKIAGCFCQCGAWLGSLGLEPSPDCGRRGRVRLRHDLTPAQRQYVVRRLLGAAPRDALNGGTGDTA